MKVADLYIRVSTDEQADKGYSQRNQEEMLRRYCDINSIQIRKVVLEDHSAKTFIRWMATAPIGYVNKVCENGKKYIAPQEPKASLIRWIFEELAKGIFTTEQVWRQALQKGFKCSKHGFWVIIATPFIAEKYLCRSIKMKRAILCQGSTNL